jgi:hypothetical protein
MLLLITPATRAQPYGEMLDSAAANSSVSTHASCLTRIACRTNWYALCSPRDFYGHHQARCGHCAPRLSP